MRFYLRVIVILFLVLSTGIFLLNYKVDPFGVWSPGSKPLSAMSIGNISYGRLAKAHWIRHQSPDIVLLGNSHAASAFQAEQFQKNELGDSPFNLALLGNSVEETFKNMRHAYFATGSTRYLVVLDLLNFRDQIEAGRNDFHIHLAESNGLMGEYFYLRNMPATNFSWSATVRSLLILRTGYNDINTPLGFVKNCSRNAAGSPRNSILVSAKRRLDSSFKSGYLAASPVSAWYAPFREMLNFIKHEDLDVTFLIPPAHVSYYHALEVSGLWQKHKDMLRTLSRGIDEYSVAKSTRVIDFTGFNEFTTELPEKGSSRLAYWQDTDHFNCALAAKIIDRVADLSLDRSQYATNHDDSLFGVLLESRSVESHIKALDLSFSTWRNEHPAKVKILERRIGAAGYSNVH